MEMFSQDKTIKKFNCIFFKSHFKDATRKEMVSNGTPEKETSAHQLNSRSRDHLS